MDTGATTATLMPLFPSYWSKQRPTWVCNPPSFVVKIKIKNSNDDILAKSCPFKSVVLRLYWKATLDLPFKWTSQVPKSQGSASPNLVKAWEIITFRQDSFGPWATHWEVLLQEAVCPDIYIVCNILQECWNRYAVICWLFRDKMYWPLSMVQIFPPWSISS